MRDPMTTPLILQARQLRLAGALWTEQLRLTAAFHRRMMRIGIPDVSPSAPMPDRDLPCAEPTDRERP